MKKIISGKVRELYEVSDSTLVIVTTDRLSAFDVILPKPVPDKGIILNALSSLWFDYTKGIIQNHIISYDTIAMPPFFRQSCFDGRVVLVKRLNILPFEFIVRGYMFGNMWEAYQKNGEFCGVKITEKYALAQKLTTPLFTPSTKAHSGHDQYVPIEYVENTIGKKLTEKVKKISLKLYEVCYNRAYEKGIIIADTKLEFGTDEHGELYVADEMFTPDSSRFWSLPDYKLGHSPKSYDKQYVRDWLLNNKRGGELCFDNIPDEVLEKTADIYKECLRRLSDV